MNQALNQVPFFFFCTYSPQHVRKVGSVTSHFTDEKTELQRGETTGSRSHGMTTDRGTLVPYSKATALPCLTSFVDILGCFRLGGYKFPEKEGTGQV